jgi:hypothetical protein
LELARGRADQPPRFSQLGAGGAHRPATAAPGIASRRPDGNFGPDQYRHYVMAGAAHATPDELEYSQRPRTSSGRRRRSRERVRPRTSQSVSELDPLRRRPVEPQPRSSLLPTASSSGSPSRSSTSSPSVRDHPKPRAKGNGPRCGPSAKPPSVRPMPRLGRWPS